ncbi:MAG: VWA domain-containing protein [Myxococcales bacterium]|nr:VWA domain-containing protein [Myxococcales bacterium]
MWERIVILMMLLVLALPLAARAEQEEIGTGQLRVVSADQKVVEVPLKHTDVQADIAGFVSRVTVTQTFVNPFKQPIEAVYVFPLPHKAAVDDMTMTIGQRVIKGVIKKREEAKQIYEAAKAAGKTASLLEQERPNIFTQSVANILPGDNIEIRISYVAVLKYEKGEYEFVFPMVVGPRYIPGEKIVGKQGGGWAPDTDKVPDASRITPPVLKPGERSGHDISVTVNLDAGVPVTDVRSTSHWITTANQGPAKAVVKLDPRDAIPNKDFILRYNVRGKAPAFGALTYSEGGKGFFLLLLAPKGQYAKQEILPREILFVVDSSGSQQGDPLAKSKDVVKRALKGLRADDTFQVFNFNDIITSMAAGPVPATAENINQAKRFIDQIESTSGTRMLPAIQAALNWPADPKRLRLVVMTTDGYIGNETEILAEIHQNLGDARLFLFGVGSSVNRYLIDRMAEEGRGFASYLRQDEPAEQVVEKFHQRLDAPVLRDLALEWGGLQTTDLYPEQIPDLYADQPLVVLGRYTKPGAATIRLTGKDAAGAKSFSYAVNLPNAKGGSDQLASLWARMRIERLMNQLEVNAGSKDQLEKDITDLGLNYRLMTQFTSFVAVEEQVRNVNGQPQTVQVPVEMPEGVSYDGVFGKLEEAQGYGAGSGAMTGSSNGPMAPPPPPSPSVAMRSYKPSPGPGKNIAADEMAVGGVQGLVVDPVAFLGIANEAPYRNALGGEVAKRLYEAVKSLAKPAGKEMMVRLTLGADGKVKKVEMLKDNTGNTDLASKLRVVLEKEKFAAPGHEAMLVFYIRF